MLEHNQSSSTYTQNSGWWQRATLAGGAKQVLSLLPVLQQDCRERVKGDTGSCVSLLPTSRRKPESEGHHCWCFQGTQQDIPLYSPRGLG